FDESVVRLIAPRGRGETAVAFSVLACFGFGFCRRIHQARPQRLKTRREAFIQLAHFASIEWRDATKRPGRLALCRRAQRRPPPPRRPFLRELLPACAELVQLMRLRRIER